MIEKKFAAEKGKIAQELVQKPGVVGVGLGYKFSKGKKTENLSVRVYVRSKKSASALSTNELIPASIKVGGQTLQTDVVEVGDIKFFSYFGRYRPARPGAVLSHYAAPDAGSFGAMVTDLTDNKKVILSACHVLANWTDGVVGDNILQPGPQNGGVNPGDKIGTLKRRIPLDFSPNGENLVDAAICTVTPSTFASSTPLNTVIKPNTQGAVGLLFAGSESITIINPATTIASLLNIKFPKIATASIGMTLHKLGAATEYTAFSVYDIHCDFLLVAPNGNDVWMRDQIVAIGGVSDAAAGDSGAICYTTYNV